MNENSLYDYPGLWLRKSFQPQDRKGGFRWSMVVSPNSGVGFASLGSPGPLELAEQSTIEEMVLQRKKLQKSAKGPP